MTTVQPFLPFALRVFFLKTPSGPYQYVKAIKFNGSIGLPLCPSSNRRSERIAVLTRARVRFSRLHRFWGHVGQAARAIEQAPGCLFTKGVGEWPLAMQATFSIWESAEAMRNFAYASEGHKEIVQKTRRENWYSEDMFARFEIEDMSGSYRDLQTTII